LDNLIDWIMMTAAVLPVVLVAVAGMEYLRIFGNSELHYRSSSASAYTCTARDRPCQGAMTPSRVLLMALEFRKDGQGYKVFSGKWALGRIREQRADPEPRWFWSLDGILGKPLALQTSGRASSLEGAKARLDGKHGGFGRSWTRQTSTTLADFERNGIPKSVFQ
jgi:hypothetical protein